MKPNHRAVRTALAVAAVALSLVAAGCGGTPGSASAVQGAVVAEAPVAAAVTLKDSSSPPRAAHTTADAGGHFSLDVSGLTPPFVLRAEWSDGSGPGRMHTVAPGGGTADVNPLTEVAVAAASRHEDAGESYDDDDAEEHHRTENRFLTVLTQLRTALAPLFELYGIGADPLADRAKLAALLRDVRFSVRQGTVTVTNRATGGVIFAGPLSDLGSGTFHPENLPGGPGTPPPPPTDGAALYAASCMSCHGPLATSEKRGATAAAIQAAISANTGGMGSTQLRALSSAQVAAIAGALATTPPPPPPAACTYTYSAWSACGTDGTQTRTVVSATPPGCTGTPVLSQACTPPIDGAALYATYCSGCHGNSRKGSSASTIQRAINNNTGGMGTAALRALTPAQIAAIAAAP